MPRHLPATILAICLLVAPLSASSSQQWFRGNTHSHTTNSDGDSPPDSVARWYRDAGYQFLFITDHETITDPAPLNARYGTPGRFLLIAGQEVTQRVVDSTRSVTALQPHLNALGLRRVVLPSGTNGRAFGVSLRDAYARNVALVHEAGGIAQVNHPNFRWTADVADLADLPDGTLMEIANAHTAVNNAGGFDPRGRYHPSTEALWDSLLTRGRRIWGVGSDDSHSFRREEADWQMPTRPGRSWIVVRADVLSASSILEAIRRGDFYSSTGVRLRDLSITDRRIAISIDSTPDDRSYTTEFVGPGGRVLATVHGRNPEYLRNGTEAYVRARIADSNGARAWLQPVFMTPPQSRLDNVRWLPGCWELSIGNRRVLERWSAAGSELHGTSVTTIGGVERESEKIRLYGSGDTLVYAAHPSRQAPAEFRAIRSSDRETVFENLAHDFPQRIIYRRIATDSLMARIEGMRNGQLRGLDYPFRRVECVP